MPEYPLMSLERKIRQWKREKGVNVKEKGRKRKEKLKTEVKGAKLQGKKVARGLISGILGEGEVNYFWRGVGLIRNL
jgi:hypothetical protein